MQLISSIRNFVSDPLLGSSPFPVTTNSWQDKLEAVFDADVQPEFKWMRQDDSHQLLAWLPGVTISELKLNIFGLTLFLGGRSRLRFQDGRFLEYVKVADFLKKFKLPDSLNLQDIKGSFQNGYLRLIFKTGPVKLLPPAPLKKITEIKSQ